MTPRDARRAARRDLVRSWLAVVAWLAAVVVALPVGFLGGFYVASVVPLDWFPDWFLRFLSRGCTP